MNAHFLFIRCLYGVIVLSKDLIMDYISGNDYYELSSGSLVSDIDLSVVTELYQPIIGFKALSIYLTFVQDIKRNDYIDIHSHESLFNRMQISSGDFLISRKALEATGLLRTFFKEENNIRYFVYALYSPKNPKDFFDDVLFKGLLIKYIGEKETLKLASKYEKSEKTGDYDEITASFVDVFDPDFNDKAFLTNIDTKLKGRKTAKIDMQFDFGVFFDGVHSKALINKQAFSDSELKEIERLAALYGLSEDSMSSIVSNIYNSEEEKGRRLNLDSLNNAAKRECKYAFISKKPARKNMVLSNDSELASKIKLMETSSPTEYLKFKQNYTSLASADIDLLNDLNREFGLSNGPLNALVDYVLTTQDNKLIRAYTEKLAAMLAREGVETAIDTMNYLNKVNSRKKVISNEKTRISNGTKNSNKDKSDGPNNEPKDENISDEELAKLLDQIDKGGSK